MVCLNFLGISQSSFTFMSLCVVVHVKDAMLTTVEYVILRIPTDASSAMISTRSLRHMTVQVRYQSFNHLFAQ